MVFALSSTMMVTVQNATSKMQPQKVTTTVNKQEKASKTVTGQEPQKQVAKVGTSAKASKTKGIKTVKHHSDKAKIAEMKKANTTSTTAPVASAPK